MIKSFAISTVTAAFITAASAQPQTAEPHKMDAVFANTATIMVAQAEQDVCPEDKKVGELTKEQREACLGAAAPQPDPFVVRLHGGVNEVSAREIIEDLLEFSKEDPDREIVFYINSLGGYVDQATAIYDTMMAIPNDIRTICEGRAMSAGHMLLTAGTPGMREARPNCTVMGHQTSGGSSGHIEDTRIRNEHSEKTNDAFIGIIARHSGWDSDVMRDIMTHNIYINAEEALEMNFIDRIIEPLKPTPPEGTKDRDDIPAWLCEGARGDIIRACVGLHND